jgi:hypothetical protein
MIYSDSALTEKTAILKSTFDKSEPFIIDADAGLSRTRYAREAAGLAYDSAETFNALLPDYHDRYSLKSINEVDFYPFLTPEEQYTYWFKSIPAIHYTFCPEKTYLDLHRIIKDKNHVILTTNTSGKFFNSSFNTNKIYFAGKNWPSFNSRTSCNDELYNNII